MLKVHTKNLGNVSVLALQGRVIKGETASLRDAVRSQSKVNAIVLDLARVSAIDAAGLGVLLELRKQTESKGIRFRLMNVSSFVCRILEITRLDSVFEITTGVEVMPARSLAVPLELARCA
jgi:anti-anti-sigma factor